jgi:hypothetical protein
MLKTRYFKGKRFIPVATPSGSNLPLIKICQEGKRYTAPPVIETGLPKITINQAAKRDGSVSATPSSDSSGNISVFKIIQSDTPFINLPIAYFVSPAPYSATPNSRGF